jgi:hypothetical protein
MTRKVTRAWMNLALAVLAVLVGARLYLPWDTLRQVGPTQDAICPEAGAGESARFPSPGRTPARSPYSPGSRGQEPQWKEMLTLLDGLDPDPLRFHGDGLFNEPFDDELALGGGADRVDAHVLAARLRDQFMVAAASAVTGEMSSSLRRYGPGALSRLGVNFAALPTPEVTEARKELATDLARDLVRVKLKARCAQFLGLVDLLIGITFVVLLAVGLVHIWKAPRRPADVV